MQPRNPGWWALSVDGKSLREDVKGVGEFLRRQVEDFSITGWEELGQISGQESVYADLAESVLN